jgi:transposase-like protein
LVFVLFWGRRARERERESGAGRAARRRLKKEIKTLEEKRMQLPQEDHITERVVVFTEGKRVD